MFHNLSGYDAHLFIKELGRKFNKDDIGVIAENKERYISFNIKINIKLAGVKDKDGKEVYKNIQLRFIDSFRLIVSRQTGKQSTWYKWDSVWSVQRQYGIDEYFWRLHCIVGMWEMQNKKDKGPWRGGAKKEF